jgi:RNA polymerase sigma factor (sigma-70 family)
MVNAAAQADSVGARTIEQAAAGDARALAQIIARYHEDMARVCVVVCGGDADIAADAVQSAWPVAWRKLGRLREASSLRSWLVAIAANEARQIMRREHRRRVVEVSVIHSSPYEEDPQGRAALADLGVALRRLGADDRSLLALRYVSGLDSNEIGSALGISASGVRSRLERLLGRLRTELRDV